MWMREKMTLSLSQKTWTTNSLPRSFSYIPMGCSRSALQGRGPWRFLLFTSGRFISSVSKVAKEEW
jgi:hypothetical protein